MSKKESQVRSADRRTHNLYQQQLFARESDGFCEPVPGEIHERLRRIVAGAGLTRGERVLDVGTGAGVLIPHIRRHGIEDVVGCDLSEEMLANARKRHKGVTFWRGDVVDLPEDLGRFDAVFLNAMFGNVWDQRETLSRVTERLRTGGRICISHPLGSGFVAGLNRSDARRTPHLLPDEGSLPVLLKGLPLEVIDYRDEEEFYLLVLKKVAPGD